MDVSRPGGCHATGTVGGAPGICGRCLGCFRGTPAAGHVAFESYATNLAPGEDNGFFGTYLWNAVPPR